MMRRYLIFLVLALAGCSWAKVVPNQLVIEKRWVRSTLDEVYLGNRRIHRFPPILLGSSVIVGNSIDGLVSYDRQSVHVNWRLPIKGGVEGGAMVDDNVLYFGASDGQLYAVQAESGQTLWTYPLKAEGLAKPMIKDGILYVLGGNNVAHCLDAKTGKLIWVYNRREASNISVRGGSQPAVAGNLVFIGFSDGEMVALNRTSGAVVWEANLNHNKRFRDVDASPVLDGANLFVSSYDGGLYSLTQDSGKINWTIDDGGFEPVVIDGKALYYSSTSGKVYGVDRDSGKILWSKTNPEGISTGPILYKGTMVVGEYAGALRFYDTRNGDLLNSISPGRGITARATADADKGEIYFLSHDANLYALEVSWKRFAKDWPWE
jgi:outer membrane protein assembly factor BamB